MTKEKREQLTKIKSTAELSYSWDCPCCEDVFVSDIGATKEEFAKDLYKAGVRYVELKHVQGLLCKECLKRDKIQVYKNKKYESSGIFKK